MRRPPTVADWSGLLAFKTTGRAKLVETDRNVGGYCRRLQLLPLLDFDAVCLLKLVVIDDVLSAQTREIEVNWRFRMRLSSSVGKQKHFELRQLPDRPGMTAEMRPSCRCC